NGLNREANHPKILKQLREDLDFCAANGVPTVICMSGNRTLKGVTVSDEEGLETCAKGLKQVVGLAEEKKVTIVMEGLNSTVNHKDYMYDHTARGVELCKKVGSERFKILWDIYHMAVMGEDVIPTLQKTKDYIAHYRRLDRPRQGRSGRGVLHRLLERAGPDAPGRPRAVRPRRDQVHPDVLRPEVVGELLGVDLQRRLGRGHAAAVVRDHPLAAE